MLKLIKLGMVACAAMVVLILTAYAAFALVTGSTPHLKSEQSQVCTSPASLTYDGFGYEVTLTERRFPVSLKGSAPSATVGRGPDHGVMVTLQSGAGADDMTCSWDAEGVRITEKHGVSHWVPASLFTGGR